MWYENNSSIKRPGPISGNFPRKRWASLARAAPRIRTIAGVEKGPGSRSPLEKRRAKRNITFRGGLRARAQINTNEPTVGDERGTALAESHQHFRA